MDRESIVASIEPVFLPPRATLTQATPPAFLAPPLNRHANWRGLPDCCVANILIRLPVLDLFRLGYLFSPRWLHIWRAQPLYLHDSQFTTPPIPAGNVADAITNVLELHVGYGVQVVGGWGGGDGGGGNEVAAGADGEDPGVIVNRPGAAVAQAQGVVVGPSGVGADEGFVSDEDHDLYDLVSNDGIIQNGGYEIGRVHFFRVETTLWRPDHIGRWCAALQRGRARLVSLANLSIPGRPDLPPALLDCTSLLGLHVFFFTVEAFHFDSLVRLRELSLFCCDRGPGMIERALHPKSEILKLMIHGADLESIAVAAPRLRCLVMFHNQNQVGTVTVDNAIQFRDLYLYPMRPSRLIINRAPRLRRIACLDLFNTVLEIQGIVIQAGMVEQPPQMPSVRILNLRVNYTAMRDRVPREIEQILRSFPCVDTLEISRDDDVTSAEGLLQWNDEHIYEGDNFFHGLVSFNNHLRWIYLTNFRGGKARQPRH
ncbi:hypothetical protein E2562_039065 [Oryza meyeriana var. granulata]|uniref:F-box/LRR-repeat protein 15/At3g58940/PEG3-like LRR domain-containing protein n=1 Tax=Oryza meyeriana var. granulata TaxID=110450 RepID=A0A6G1BPB4_9ORYZ|nr:hypothetical protein E2562_039065 [Oryza meyeriana var. granulata]